ncbi:MAG: NYN domain-containing protein [Anaerolineae bacterium]
MSHDIAIFLDLDNLVIGAKQINLTFDINLILEHIKAKTNGRVVLRRSYGDWRQSQKLLQELTRAGFTTQSTVRINNLIKNLADMQIIVDAMDTLVDGHQYSTYVLITGDRDFTPLVQSLRKRGKRVIGVGIRQSASSSFVQLCDEYVFYEDLVPTAPKPEIQVEALLERATNELLKGKGRVRASVLNQKMRDLSHQVFDASFYASKSFRLFLEQYPHLVTVEQEGSTTYVRLPRTDGIRPLHLRYRSELKRRKLRVIKPRERLRILKDLMAHVEQNSGIRWRQLIDEMSRKYQAGEWKISKDMVNAVMLVARRAQILLTQKGRTLASAPVSLADHGSFQEAVIRCDAVYLRQILDLEEPFDLTAAAEALYDSPKYGRYLQQVMEKWVER